MGDLSGFGGMWRTLVGQWEKICFLYLYLYSYSYSDLYLDSRTVEDGGRRASAGQGGVEEGSGTCQGGCMTIEDGPGLLGMVCGVEDGRGRFEYFIFVFVFLFVFVFEDG